MQVGAIVDKSELFVLNTYLSGPVCLVQGVQPKEFPWGTVHHKDKLCEGKESEGDFKLWCLFMYIVSMFYMYLGSRLLYNELLQKISVMGQGVNLTMVS